MRLKKEAVRNFGGLFYFKMMKARRFFLTVILFCSFECAFSEDYRKVYVDLPYGEKTLKSTFFCFNDLATGAELAFDLYGIRDLKSELRRGGFKKLMMIPPGSEISAYNYSVMTYGREFWFFENRDDGWLWGTGWY